MTTQERRAIRARRARVDQSVEILKADPAYAGVQFRTITRTQEMMDAFSPEERQLATKSRLDAVIRVLDVRSEEYLGLVKDIRSQEAFATVLNEFGHQAWQDTR